MRGVLREGWGRHNHRARGRTVFKMGGSLLPLRPPVKSGPPVKVRRAPELLEQRVGARHTHAIFGRDFPRAISAIYRHYNAHFSVMAAVNSMMKSLAMPPSFSSISAVVLERNGYCSV